MKLRVLVPFATSLLLLIRCSAPAAETTAGSSASRSEETLAATVEEVVVQPLVLTGEWKQTNLNSADSYQAASMTGEQVTVDWVNAADSTKAVCWIGSHVEPTEDTECYSWDFQGDVAQMETAPMASGDTAKAFTFEDGVLAYELTAMGDTMTVEMSR